MRVTVSLVEFRALPSPIKEAAVSVQEETEKLGVMADIWIYNSTQPDLFQSPETATSSRVGSRQCDAKLLTFPTDEAT